MLGGASSIRFRVQASGMHLIWSLERTTLFMLESGESLYVSVFLMSLKGYPLLIWVGCERDKSTGKGVLC